jgi:hypothetical protein
MYAGMLELVATFDDVRYVQSVPGDIEGTYDELCRQLAE